MGDELLSFASGWLSVGGWKLQGFCKGFGGFWFRRGAFPGEGRGGVPEAKPGRVSVRVMLGGFFWAMGSCGWAWCRAAG